MRKLRSAKLRLARLAGLGEGRVMGEGVVSEEMRLLGISGSLRARSVNTAILRAAAMLAPEGVSVELFDGLGELPHFNPDLDDDDPPAAVVAFREAVREADGVLICSPEYAHGVPGTIKNGLDWLVSFPPFAGKPIGIINARAESVFAFASLRETLSVMSANLVESAIVTLPLRTNVLDAEALASMPEVADVLRAALRGMLDTAS